MASGIRRVAWGMVAMMGSCLPISPGRACIPIAPEGAPPPRITDEAAVILWDKKQGVEHFIRRAAFSTDAARLAFLVPTPTVPELDEANPNMFRVFEKPMEPKIVEWVNPFPAFYSWIFGGQSEPPPLSASPASGAPPPLSQYGYPGAAPPGPILEVLGQETVSGYDATILKATDANALNAFLKKNGYPASPTVLQWLEPYVKKGWIITAFKVNKNSSTGPRLAPVRMSFSTTRPFYPYREPPAAKDTVHYPRSLRIFFLSQEGRMGATLGEKGPTWGTGSFQRLLPKVSFSILPYDAPENLGVSMPDRAGVEWAGNISVMDNITTLRENGEDVRSLKLFLEPFAVKGYLTVLTDTQSPRPGTDELYFSHGGDQRNIETPPIYHVTNVPMAYFPIEPFLSAPLFIVGFILWRRRKGTSAENYR